MSEPHNIVSVADLGVAGELDLKKLCNGCRYAEYNHKRFQGLILRRRDPKTTALIFKSGRMIITGAKSEEASL